MDHHTVGQLQALYESDRRSLGIVRPSSVLDVEIERAEPEWKPEWQVLFQQLRLIGPEQLPLRKIPYTFRYVFECEDSERPHRAMIEDWELGALFLKESTRLGSDEAAAESVRDKFLSELCREDKDTRFFMGTVLPYNTWLVLGVFWPPKIDDPKVEQLQLLESQAEWLAVMSPTDLSKNGLEALMFAQLTENPSPSRSLISRTRSRCGRPRRG